MTLIIIKDIICSRGDYMNYFVQGLGSQISEIRNLLGWTQKDLAKKIGISRSSIVKIENDPANMKK